MSGPLLLLALVAADPGPDALGAPAADAAGADPVVAPPPPVVEARLHPAEVRVGEPLTFEVAVTHDGSRAFRLPDSPDFGKAELVERHALAKDPPSQDGQITERYAFTLAFFEPGRHSIPDLELPYVDLRGREFQVRADGGVVACKSVLANEAAPELKAPPGPRPLIVEDRRPLYAAGVLGVALTAALLAFLVGRFMRGRAPAEPPPPPIPAEVIALGRLQALRARNLPRQGMVKEFYLELSHILREYFGNRFSVAALEMTTEELLVHLTDVRLRGVRRSTVERFLGDSDLVKFAKYVPTDEEVAEIFLSAEDIVHRTTPRAASPPPDGDSVQEERAA